MNGCRSRMPVTEQTREIYRLLSFNDENNDGVITRSSVWNLWTDENYNEDADVNGDGYIIAEEARAYLQRLGNDDNAIKQRHPVTATDRTILMGLFRRKLSELQKNNWLLTDSREKEQEISEVFVGLTRAGLFEEALESANKISCYRLKAKATVIIINEMDKVGLDKRRLLDLWKRALEIAKESESGGGCYSGDREFDVRVPFGDVVNSVTMGMTSSGFFEEAERSVENTISCGESLSFIAFKASKSGVEKEKVKRMFEKSLRCTYRDIGFTGNRGRFSGARFRSALDDSVDRITETYSPGEAIEIVRGAAAHHGDYVQRNEGLSLAIARIASKKAKGSYSQPDLAGFCIEALKVASGIYAYANDENKRKVESITSIFSQCVDSFGQSKENNQSVKMFEEALDAISAMSVPWPHTPDPERENMEKAFREKLKKGIRVEEGSNPGFLYVLSRITETRIKPDAINELMKQMARTEHFEGALQILLTKLRLVDNGLKIFLDILGAGREYVFANHKNIIIVLKSLMKEQIEEVNPWNNSWRENYNRPFYEAAFLIGKIALWARMEGRSDIINFIRQHALSDIAELLKFENPKEGMDYGYAYIIYPMRSTLLTTLMMIGDPLAISAIENCGDINYRSPHDKKHYTLADEKKIAKRYLKEQASNSIFLQPPKMGVFE